MRRKNSRKVKTLSKIIIKDQYFNFQKGSENFLTNLDGFSSLIESLVSLTESKKLSFGLQIRTKNSERFKKILFFTF